jgi:predicted Zn-ribbon and HTH transcriptional regulator
MTYAHRDALLRAYTSAVLRARAAYATDTRCKTCGDPIDRHPNRLPTLCPTCKEAS